MIIPNSNNEWGELKEIIVGSVENAQIPTIKDKALHCIDYAHLSDDEFENIPTGPYPQKVIEETYEDLEEICITLYNLGV
jgi:glycine amidinotransferase/scyllo-inosamine-4-phosphate amidinotransferase 1